MRRKSDNNLTTKRHKKKRKEKIFGFRITDLGALFAIEHTKAALMEIALNEKFDRIKTIKELKKKLKEDLKKYVGWIEKRERDGTLLGRYTKKDLNKIIKTAKKIIAWEPSPPKKDLVSLRAEKESLLALESPIETIIEKIKILMDTNLLISYIIKDEKNHLAAKILVGYLKPQQRYFELYLPNFVLFELVSQFKKYYKFSKVKENINNLLDTINPKNVYTGGIRLDMLEIYERYKLFSRKKISSRLKGNDFIIASEGMISKAMILTCDKQFYKNCRKIYKDTYFISSGNDSDFPKFVKKFEEERRELKTLRIRR